MTTVDSDCSSCMANCVCVATDFAAMCLCACSRCKARLLRASKSAALVKTAQQHATKLEGILAVAFEAHTNFQTSFSLAVAASTQQHQQQQQSITGQQEPWAPSPHRLCSSLQQQGNAPPGSCPGRLQQGSCSSPGVALAPRFFTACGEAATSQKQQQLEECSAQAAVQEEVQQHSCAAQLSTSISHKQLANSNALQRDGLPATGGTEKAASLLLQTSQPGFVHDAVAAALECMPDYQRAWALLQQVWWSLQRHHDVYPCSCAEQP
jgi:hypothetical protein